MCPVKGYVYQGQGHYMKILEFLTTLANKNITFVANGERLQCKGPKGVLSNENKAFIKENKEEILALLKNANNARHNATVGPTPIKRDKRDYPLTLQQTSLWYTHMLNGNDSTYNITVMNELYGELDCELLIKCIVLIYQRHEGLRTRFIEVDFEPRQSIRDENDFNPYVELVSESDVAGVFQEECDFHFDLENDPLFRVRLLSISPTSNALILNMHHAISDGHSVGVILQEIDELYKNNGDIACLDEQYLHYVDFAVWFEERVKSPEYAEAKEYWLGYLKDAPPTSIIAADFSSLEKATSEASVVWFSIPEAVKAKLLSIANDSACTLYVVLLACFNILLCKFTNQKDLLIGTMSENRRWDGLNNIVGYFANPLVIRTKLSEPQSFEDVIRQVKSNVKQAMRHQEVSFIDVATSLKLDRGSASSLLFQILFLYGHDKNGELVLPGVETRYVEQQAIHAMYDFTISLMVEESKGFKGVFTFNKALYKEDTVREIIKEYSQLLENVALGENVKSDSKSHDALDWS